MESTDAHPHHDPKPPQDGTTFAKLKVVARHIAIEGRATRPGVPPSAGPWQDENAIYVGGGLFWGHGLLGDLKTELEMREELWQSDYNAFVDAGLVGVLRPTMDIIAPTLADIPGLTTSSFVRFGDVPRVAEDVFENRRKILKRNP